VITWHPQRIRKDPLSLPADTRTRITAAAASEENVLAPLQDAAGSVGLTLAREPKMLGFWIDRNPRYGEKESPEGRG
jgi:hypothetical protein